MSAPTIALENVRRRYNGTGGVADVTLTLPAGRITSILGASGSGKTTLLRLIAGLDTLESGRIRFDEQLIADAHAATPAEQRRVGLVFQEHALFPHLRVWENVAFGLTGPRSSHEAIAARWLAHVDLAHRAQAYPAALSGGEQQRVALARALAPDPLAVLLDEPFSSLDPVLRSDLRERTRALLSARGKTTAFVSHDAEEAMFLADHLAIMKDGLLLQTGPPQEVYRHPVSAEAAGALGPIQLWPGLIRAGRLDTPFGHLAASGFAEGVRALGVVRQEALRLIPGDHAAIVALRPMGSFTLILLQIGAQTCWVRAAPDDALAQSARASLAIDPAGAHVFAV